MDKDKISELLKLNSIQHKQIRVNNRWICKFVHQNSEKLKYFFSQFEKLTSCPRYVSYADVTVIDCNTDEHMAGKLYVNLDTDLGEHGYYSMTLVLIDLNCKVKSIITITDFEIEDIIEDCSLSADSLKLANTEDDVMI